VSQIDLVWKAVKAGAVTSVEVSSVSGLPLKHCTAYMRELEFRGIIERVGLRKFHRGCRPAVEYAIRRKVPHAEADEAERRCRMKGLVA
jgi:hypothetical protein